jgi:hypothetical protein
MYTTHRTVGSRNKSQNFAHNVASARKSGQSPKFALNLCRGRTHPNFKKNLSKLWPVPRLGRRRRRRIADRPLVPTAIPSMLHFSRVSKDNEHAMHLHCVVSGSSMLTGNAGDVPQLPVGQGPPPPPPPGTGTTSARRLAALHRARDYLLTYLLLGPAHTKPRLPPPLQTQKGSRGIFCL